MSFPFPQLLAFLEEGQDQVEFMKVAAEAGLGSGDIEMAKLLVALQLYKSYYAAIPRQIKAVHEDALAEIGRVRDEIESISNRASSDAAKIGQWAEEIQRSLQAAEPTKLAEMVHKRLLDDTVKNLSGSMQAIATANGQIDAATQKMNAAAQQAAASIQEWQTLSLRRVWASAFCVCMVAAFLVSAGFWFVLLRH